MIALSDVGINQERIVSNIGLECQCSKCTTKDRNKTQKCFKKRYSMLKTFLLSSGIFPGVRIKVKGKTPLGDPIIIIVKNQHFCLRKNEAQHIFMHKVL